MARPVTYLFPADTSLRAREHLKGLYRLRTAITVPRRRGEWRQADRSVHCVKLFRNVGFSAANTQLHQQRKHSMRQVVGQLIMFSQLLPEDF